ncbi:lysophosphatidylserine lipase ABHD12-like [Photinus pyralis]|uniref:Serine aminopeptidase S33 domain-containing protein n=2 Tax=Photinus pyralis TaxID=7054 RepID=A0A1Y1KM14_PHOPY|nr:lysophosphatidylserine lipase ABHD12-like [Photinus pyralis]XP_031357773.1 lysophosphatidylserine lipase ABHD12-like [Photinus pyralis]
MSAYELEFACLIPKSKSEDLTQEPFFTYKSTEYKKTLRFRIPACKPITSRLGRFWNWMRFVWSHSRSRKYRRICYTFVLSVLIIFLTTVYIATPLLFKFSSSVRRHVIFSPTVAPHGSFNEVIEIYTDYNSKTLYKPKNLYVAVNKEGSARLGVWRLSQHAIRPSSGGYNRQLPVDNVTTNNYLLYFHDGYGNRRDYITDYSKLSYLFNVIAFDYRAYGDSYDGSLNEEGLVRDGVQLYKWLRSQVNASIYFWGDNLGSAIAAHTVAQLERENLYPCGILLENGFTTMGEQLGYSWFIARMNWYTPWYKTVITDTLAENDLSFNTNKHLNEISCPIRFLEWEYHRAKRFNVKTSYDDYYSQGFLLNAKNAISFNRYYKTERVWTDQNFLRSFVKDGRSHCDSKKL